jgi:DNA polymerase-1
VWHNYGFDRHVLNNEGIDVKGFFADTMHLARLHNTSRDKLSGGSVNGTGYSLEALSEDLISIKVRLIPPRVARGWPELSHVMHHT